MNILLDEINELIEEEHGEPIGMEDAVVSSGIDSFGLIAVLMEIDERYQLWGSVAFSKIKFGKITPEEIQRLIDESK